jgi:hypothetical protein
VRGGCLAFGFLPDGRREMSWLYNLTATTR